jgi:phosphopantothenoylcysteine decarboxylase/phosphopantothenate--cysteine ligase
MKYPYLENKKVLIGVSSGIAVYKAIDLVSKLRKMNVDLKIIMTENARNWISDQIFSAVGNCDVFYSTFDVKGGWIPHTELSNWADLFIVAPATANIIAKIACGISDDLLTSTAIAFAKKSKIIVPTMNVRMYENQALQRNLKTLETDGWMIIEPEIGHLADGESGKGRYPDNEKILEYAEHVLCKKDFLNKKVLISAGPTIEKIDPVRFISNRSSGKMGYELSREFACRGAEVTLVSGPTNLTVPSLIKNFIPVESALDMEKAIVTYSENSDIIIMTAAVSDFRVKNYSTQKLKKDNIPTLVLEKNPDILKELGQKKRENQILIGFAAETQNHEEYAKKKLKEKNLDMIVVNDVSRRDIGFESDENEIIVYSDGEEYRLEKNHKRIIAAGIANYIYNKFF